MVNVLSSNDRSDGAGLLSMNALGGVLELGTLLGQTPLVLLGVVVIDLTVLDWDNVVVVGLGEHLLVLNRLHRSMKVILVDLLVDSG